MIAVQQSGEEVEPGGFRLLKKCMGSRRDELKNAGPPSGWDVPVKAGSDFALRHVKHQTLAGDVFVGFSQRIVDVRPPRRQDRQFVHVVPEGNLAPATTELFAAGQALRPGNQRDEMRLNPRFFSQRVGGLLQRRQHLAVLPDRKRTQVSL